MRTRLLIIVVAVAVLLTCCATPAAAHCRGPVVFKADMAAGTPEHPDTWFGNLRCGLKGTVEFGELPWNDTGPSLSTFAEWFTITTKHGEMQGFDMGIWYPDFKFRASGWVTQGTGCWEHSVGWMVYEQGQTTDPSLEGPVYANGVRMMLMPAPHIR